MNTFRIPRSPKDKFKGVTKMLKFIENNIDWKHTLGQITVKGVKGIEFGFKESGNTTLIFKYPTYYLVKCLLYPTELKRILLKFKV